MRNFIFLEILTNLNLNQNEIKKLYEDFSPKITKYNGLSYIYGLPQLINCPTRVTCITSTLIDHILINTQNNISQSGAIDTAIHIRSLHDILC